MHYLIFIIFLFSPFSVLAIDNACLLSKYERYAAAQYIWQKDLTSVVTTNSPDLKEVAEIYLNDQLVLINKRLIAVTLLLSESPEKLKTDLKVNRWVQLDAADESELAKHHASYDQILKQHIANKNRKPHEDGNKLREVIRTQVTPSKEFKAIYSSFSNRVNDIDNIVCSAI